MISRSKIFIFLLLGSLSVAASEEGYFSEKFHSEHVARIYYSYYHLENPQTQSYGTEFRVPSFEFLWSSKEGTRNIGFGLGGDLKYENSYKPAKLGFTQLSFEQFLNTDKSGLFFKIKVFDYKVSVTEGQSSTMKTELSFGGGYAFPINKYISLAVAAGKLSDSITFRKPEYLIELYLDVRIPGEETNFVNELRVPIVP